MINDDKHDKDLIILDVREPKDFNNGHLLNAINIPIENIDKRMDELRNYKSKDIIVYCNTGRKKCRGCRKTSRTWIYRCYKYRRWCIRI